MALKVLILDDEIAFQKLLQLRLKAFLPEANFTCCTTLKEARQILNNPSNSNFDLIIIDEHLPDGRGIEFLKEKCFQDEAVMMISSDIAPETPGASMLAGAHYFLSKIQISEPLFQPLVKGIVARNILQHQLNTAKLRSVISDTVRRLVSTLRHEINNPLGAVLGAAYLLRSSQSATPDQKETAALVEASGQRIKHVLDQLCKEIELETVEKAGHAVFHIPGDKPWED